MRYSNRYIKNNEVSFSDYEKFKGYVFQKVKKNWKRAGNEFVGLDDNKLYRILSGKQQDFDTIMKMAEFMRMDFRYTEF